MSRVINVIGLAGPARVGKSSMAGFLQDELPEFSIYAFAGPVKAMVNAIFGWDGRHADGALKEIVDSRVGISPREAYQKLGTEFGREILFDLLPKICFPRGQTWIARAQRELDDKQFLIIPDVRFPDEVEWIDRVGGLLVHIQRAGTFGLSGAVTGHASERGVPIRNADWVTAPCKDLAELRICADQLADYIRSHK